MAIGRGLKRVLIGIGALVIMLTGIVLFYWYTAIGGIGLPWVTSLDLPPFPEYPAPAQTLSADSEGDIYIASKSPFDLSVVLQAPESAADTTVWGQLFMPETASVEAPVPAMVLLHGSGGIAPGREMEYAELLNANGIAALIIDYYAARGLTDETPYIIRVMGTTEIDVLWDAYAALDLLATHPKIDPARIGVAGYSYGGMVARYALDPRIRPIIAPEAPPFAAHVDFYGPCHQTLGAAASTGAPFLSIRGTEDASNELAFCAEAEADLAAAGSSVEAIVYEGAAHAWEVEIPRSMMESSPYVQGCHFSFDADGFPTIDGDPAPRTALDASRGERAVARGKVSFTVPHCVKRGYIIGKDQETQTKANAAFLAFLRKTFRLDAIESASGTDSTPG